MATKRKAIPPRLREDNYIYKVGLDYGLVEEHPRNIVFYFEWLKQQEDIV